MSPPLKIFPVAQIKAADAFTIEHEPVTSIDLMERAAFECLDWLIQHLKIKQPIHVFCGLGNNGGDGLALARMLHNSGFDFVNVYILRYSEKFSPDFEKNLSRLKLHPEIKNIELTASNIPEKFPLILENDVIIDAIFGTGLSKETSGLVADCIQKINAGTDRKFSVPTEIISIDIPSGLFADLHSNPDSSIIKATTTLTFQFPKLAFMFPENADFVGDVEVLDIGLSEKFIGQTPTEHYYLDKNFVKTLIKPRKKFSHKGTFGHALIIAGSYGKIGAALLSGNACLRSGVGLLTMYIPESGNDIIQNGIPEAMTESFSRLVGWSVSQLVNRENKNLDQPTNRLTDQPTKFNSIGIGPGIGTDEQTQTAVIDFLKNISTPIVMDADALNILSLDKSRLKLLPPNSILTPHPKEFERLTFKPVNDFERHELQINFSIEHKVFVVLKGANTCITTPEGKSYFNSTGNPGMAKGGSGDILTGILTGLLAQGYSPLETCLLGVYVHGLAGDLAKKNRGEIGMISGDIIEFLPEAFINLVN